MNFNDNENIEEKIFLYKKDLIVKEFSLFGEGVREKLLRFYTMNEYAGNVKSVFGSFSETIHYIILGIAIVKFQFNNTCIVNFEFRDKDTITSYPKCVFMHLYIKSVDNKKLNLKSLLNDINKNPENYRIIPKVYNKELLISFIKEVNKI